MLAKASKLSKRMGGSAKGIFGRAKAAAADKMATLEQEWQQMASEEQERSAASGATGSNAAGTRENRRRAWPRHYVRIALLPVALRQFSCSINHPGWI